MDFEPDMDDVARDDPRRQPEAVLVTGMHASGTAMLARIVALLHRAASGGPVDPDAEQFPHVEHSSAVAALNQRILQEIGADWRKPCLLFLKGKSVAQSTALIRDFVRERYLDLAVGVVRSGAAVAPVILEDPSLCLFHDLWSAALRQAGYRVQTILVVRNPLEVAAALKTSHRLGISKSLQAWLHHNLSLLTTAPHDQDLIVVPYAALLQPVGDLTGMLQAGLGWSEPDAADATVATAATAMLDAARREPGIPARVLAQSPLVPSLLKRAHALLSEWPARDSAGRDAEVAELAAAYEDQSLFAGNLLQVTLPAQEQPAAPAIASGAGETRKVLVHYHLFKNAGTSVDAILRRNFGARWINTEFPPPGQANHQEAIRRLILDNPNLAAVSSHTLMPPAPEIDGVEIFPILFVRHPLDRLKSAYEFERKQEAMTAGSKLAKSLDFAGYIRARLAIKGDRSCRDFHAHRLAMAVPTAEGTERERALMALDRLPFVGLVDQFDASMAVLEQRVRAMFPEFRAFEAWENVTKSRERSLEERVAAIREELGEECFALVMEANEGDLAVYERVRGRYASMTRGFDEQVRRNASVV